MFCLISSKTLYSGYCLGRIVTICNITLWKFFGRYTLHNIWYNIVDIVWQENIHNIQYYIVDIVWKENIHNLQYYIVDIVWENIHNIKYPILYSGYCFAGEYPQYPILYCRYFLREYPQYPILYCGYCLRKNCGSISQLYLTFSFYCYLIFSIWQKMKTNKLE